MLLLELGAAIVIGLGVPLALLVLLLAPPQRKWWRRNWRY